jgi:uncharacterized protein
MVAVGQMHMLGDPAAGIQRDPDLAANMFNLAAEQGFPAAHAALGMMAVQGIGMPVNYTAAWENYSLAAQGGVPEGHLGLGYLMMKGLGVPQNVPAALDHFVIAANAGVLEAQSNLGVGFGFLLKPLEFLLMHCPSGVVHGRQ